MTIWNQSSGYSIGTFEERVALVDTTLPVVNPADTTITYTLISGSLPAGIRLVGADLVGTPFDVPRPTESTFVIRAKQGNTFADRTLKITVQGADAPVFLTAEGSLAVGTSNQYYTLDSSFIDFQLEAFDLDLATGQKLTYFIEPGNGILPPGLTLTQAGRIIGFVQPTISIKPEDGDGSFDNSFYDVVAYDFAIRPTNGYDSYIYDTKVFDYGIPAYRPKKLNRNYEFIVTVTDGDSVVKRKFAIFVVGDDYFRADNTFWLDGTGLFTADATYLRAPVWLTAENLGTFRANNYVTLIIDTYDTTDITYSLVDAVDAWATGTNYAVNDLITITVTGEGDPVIYSYICIEAHNSGVAFDNTKWANYGLPPGMRFNQNTGEVFGSVPYQPAISKIYRFTVSATRYGTNEDTAISYRTFYLNLIGEIDSNITWVSGSDLGTINANFVSTIKLEATSTAPSATLLYTVTGGTLPPGLTLDLDGELVGKVRQYGNTDAGLRGITLLDGVEFKLDGGKTIFDKVFTFTVKAKDQYGYSASEKTFFIKVDTPDNLVYSNIRTKPFLKISQRNNWKDFINNTSIFTPTSIYRPNDPSFGLQTELSMLVYAGIETKAAASYVGAMGLNHKKKRFHFGAVNKAIAYTPGTNTAVYEVIYITMIDPLEAKGLSLSSTIRTNAVSPETITVDASNSIWAAGYQPFGDAEKDAFLERNALDAYRVERITVDSTGYQASNPNVGQYYPSSISNWRDNLSGVGATERNYLPLWMRSYQPGSKEELGFTLAVPLCYCKVGTADDILLNIKNHIATTGFDFKLLDYTADRYIIDSVTGVSSDKYLVFRNDRITTV